MLMRPERLSRLLASPSTTKPRLDLKVMPLSLRSASKPAVAFSTSCFLNPLSSASVSAIEMVFKMADFTEVKNGD